MKSIGWTDLEDRMASKFLCPGHDSCHSVEVEARGGERIMVTNKKPR